MDIHTYGAPQHLVPHHNHTATSLHSFQQSPHHLNHYHTPSAPQSTINHHHQHRQSPANSGHSVGHPGHHHHMSPGGGGHLHRPGVATLHAMSRAGSCKYSDNPIVGSAKDYAILLLAF